MTTLLRNTQRFSALSASKFLCFTRSLMNIWPLPMNRASCNVNTSIPVTVWLSAVIFENTVKNCSTWLQVHHFLFLSFRCHDKIFMWISAHQLSCTFQLQALKIPLPPLCIQCRYSISIVGIYYCHPNVQNHEVVTPVQSKQNILCSFKCSLL